MANFSHIKESIGSAGGRNFSTLLAYLTALPNPFVNEARDGAVHADSDFDEHNLGIQPGNAGDNPSLHIHGALGELPVFKPASGAGGTVITIATNMSLVGLTADGANLTGSPSMFQVSVTRASLIGCVARNAVIGINNLSGSDITLVYCLAENCSGDGITANFPGSNSWYLGCGVVNCGVGFAGRSGTIKAIIISSWALNNTIDIEASTIAQAKFVYISDESWPAGDDVFRNQVPANLGFVNFAGGDYRLAAGSPLIAMGYPLWSTDLPTGGARPSPVASVAGILQLGTQDAFGQSVGLDFGTRMNIGPFQPGRAEAVPDTPTLVHTSTP